MIKEINPNNKNNRGPPRQRR